MGREGCKPTGEGVGADLTVLQPTGGGVVADLTVLTNINNKYYGTMMGEKRFFTPAQDKTCRVNSLSYYIRPNQKHLSKLQLF